MALAAALLGAAGCGGPLGPFPGGALRGSEVEEAVESWSFAEAYSSLSLETRPEDPYSVHVGFVLREGRLYLDPEPERRWYRHLEADPRARVRLGGRVYPVRATRVSDSELLSNFEAGRVVLRLDPRAP